MGRLRLFHGLAGFSDAARLFFFRAFVVGADGVTHSVAQGLGSDELNNIDIYKASRDSVVYVTSTVYRRTFFFDVVPQRDLGSGFLINAEGQILTNYHVISGSSQVEVTLPDQTRHKAEVVVRDQTDDLALIRISPKKNLPHLSLGDSDHLQVGQKVLAIGNPFGLSGTLTTGVVSSLGRDIQSENNQTLEGMIQTDAAINSGNSGGPLLDSQGNVIGINTAIYGPNGGNVGIGFAIPINRVKTMLDDFRANRNLRASAAGDLHGLHPGRRFSRISEASSQRRPADTRGGPRLRGGVGGPPRREGGGGHRESTAWRRR